MQSIFGGGDSEDSGYGDPGIGGGSPIVSRPSVNQRNVPNIFDMGGDSGDASGINNQPDEVSALDQFRQSVMNPPQHENPGILRALGTGALSALGGSEKDRKPVYNAAGKVIGSKQMSNWERLGNDPMDTGEAGKILNMPNESRLADYKTRTAGLKEAATLETNLAKNAGLPEQRLANASAIPKRVDQGQQRVDIANKTQALNEWKAKNPQGKIYAPKGGNVVIINPLTGEATDTGIDTGSLSDEDKIKLTGQQRTSQIDQQGKIRSGQIDQQGDIRSGQITQQGEEARQTKEVIPGKSSIFASTTNKEDTPGQHKIRLQTRANEYIQAHPEHADFIKINPNTGMVDITPPSKNWYGGTSGPDQKTYDEMVNHMKSGESAPGSNAANKKPLTTTESKNDSAAPIKSDKPGQNRVGSVTDKGSKGTAKESPNSGGNTNVITQRNKSTGQIRTSTDGGKTWTMK